MRHSLVLLATLLAACGTDPVTSATDAGTGSASTTQDNPSTTNPTTPTTTTADPTTDTSGTAGMTDSGTTTTGDPQTTTTTTTTTEPSTGPVVETDTGPGTSTTGTTTGTDTTTSGSTTTDTTGTSESSTTGEEACACPDLEVPLDDGIFVLSITAELWKYFPETNTFDSLGPIGCGLPPTTFSMAVDRTGFAWVQYQGGELRKVSVTNVANCTDPNYPLGQTAVANFGMAFVSNSESDACDRIYGNTATGLPEGNNVADFFSIDPVTLKATIIGKSNYGTAEVTGTGDGRAFFFAGANPAKLVEIDKATGKSLNVIPLPGVELGNAWAFAFFAGDFYFFTNSKGGPGSEVTHIDYDDSDNNGKQDIKQIVDNAPISIVGAGVSTCAPTAPQ